ncbi:hypothetical protein [Paenibacillus sp. DRB1-1]|uniref:hypothetical protein n=1 Tax=Paenibacillus sp. DRB1-1 TaxID=3422309 RepID=UPI003F9897A7
MKSITAQTERYEDTEYIKERLERGSELLYRYMLILLDEGDHDEAKEAKEISRILDYVRQEMGDDLALRSYDLIMEEYKK